MIFGVAKFLSFLVFLWILWFFLPRIITKIENKSLDIEQEMKDNIKDKSS